MKRRAFGQKILIVLFFTVFWEAQARADVCDKEGNIEAAVSKILSLAASRLHVDSPQVWTLSIAHDFSQKYLMRPRGSERLSEPSVLHYKELFSLLSPLDVEQMLAALNESGFSDAIGPLHSEYDYIILNGSTAQSVRRRIHEVSKAVYSGAIKLTPTTQIVFLDGERKLFASETREVLLDPSPYQKESSWVPPKTLPSDEREMDEMLWQQMWMPSALRKQGVLFVHAQKKEKATRAETSDCVEAWVKAHHPQKGRALVVSNNPFIEYQRRVTEVLLEKSGARELEVEAMGPAAEISTYDAPTRLGVLLDALAGTLFRAAQQQELKIVYR